MAAPWIDPTLCLVVTVGVGGSALGLLGLLLPSPLRGAWKALPVGLGVLAGGFCVLALLLGQPPTTWGPTLGLLGACVVLWLARTKAAQHVWIWFGRGARSPRCQAAGLLLVCPAFAIWCIPTEADADPFDASPIELNSTFLTMPPREEIRPSPVQTDRQRPLVVYKSLGRQPFTPEFLAKQSARLRAWGFSERIITLPGADSDCNCHGWVFTGGRYWVGPTDVLAILQDNDYRPSDVPQTGDLILYRKGELVLHTGIVRAADADAQVLVESKWGVLGRFIHPPEVHPYGDCAWTYHRSSRQGHLLRGLPGASTSELPPTLPDITESAQAPAGNPPPFAEAAE